MNIQSKFSQNIKAPEVIALAEKGKRLTLLLVHAKQFTFSKICHASDHIDDILTDEFTLARNIAATVRRS